jgi:excisionase family DNA binding protein
MKRKLLTTGQAAEHCSVTRDAVLKWIKSGRLKARRTAGGHYRVDPEDLNRLDLAGPEGADRFCWELRSEDGEVAEACEDCLAYRSRAKRCFELAAHDREAVRLTELCPVECEDCGYFRLVEGHSTKVAVLTPDPILAGKLGRAKAGPDLDLMIARSEYSLSAALEEFRPDFVVIDTLIGRDRARQLGTELSDDCRLPFIRLLFATAGDEAPDFCDGRIFGHIQRPFTLANIRTSIARIRKEG